MSGKVVVNQGTLIWCGEHWINYLREPGAAANTGMVSLFHTRYSGAGEGNVAFVTVPSTGLDAVCTDNPELAGFLVDTIVRGRGGPFDRNLPTLSARFSRGGDVREAPSWRIETGTHLLIAAWAELTPPIIAQGIFREGHEHFTVLFFAAKASIRVGENLVPGEPYPVPIWRESIGGDRSSCVFALAETFIKLPE
jgi:hypothetical protein